MSLKEDFALLPDEVQEEILAELDPEIVRQMAMGYWWWESRPEQVPPAGEWTVHLYLAGRGCIAPWTRIYSAGTDEWIPVAELAKRNASIQVLTADGAKAWTEGPPFLKGFAAYWTVKLESGQQITVTDQHRFLTPQGWRQLSSLRAGQLLAEASPAAMGAISPLSKWPADDLHYKQTAADYLDGYLKYPHQYGQQLLQVSDTCPALFPLLAGADAHIQPLSGGDGPGISAGCSHLHQPHIPHSRNSSSRVWPSREAGLGLVQPCDHGHTLQTGRDRSDPGSPSRSGQCQPDCEAYLRRYPYAGPELCAYGLQGLAHGHVMQSRLSSVCAGQRGNPHRRIPLSSVPSRQPDSGHKFLQWEEDVSHSNAHDHFIKWSRIVSISPAGFGPYYDLTVPEIGHYLAEGIYNHNSGKTRSGAEWLVDRTEQYPLDSSGFPTERLVMAYSLSDARLVCIEGPSGIIRVLETRGYREVKDHYKGDLAKTFHYIKSPKPCLTLLETGAKIFFSGSEIDAARGLNLADIWADEIIKWAEPAQVWREGLRPALRADVPGDKPRAFVTTTPRPISLLQDWLKQESLDLESGARQRISVVRGSTFDNKLNLSEDFLEDITKMYEGTALGRQELYGEMLEMLEGALFSYASIDTNRVKIGPERVAHRTVGVDPGLTGAEDGDEMGVVVACRSHDDHIYVLADETTRLAGRDAALHAWRVFSLYEADTLVYESNLGKAWMHQVFTDAFRELQKAGVFPREIVNAPLVPVFSNQGKKLRAEPVAMRYSQGRVHHIGKFERLESQMMMFDPLSSKSSPDRLDALVHACRHLINGERRRSRILSPLTKKIDSLAHDLI